MAMPVNNITFTAPITSPVTNATFLPSRTLKPDLQTDEPTTGSVMTKDATSCSLEVCAEQHFWVLASVAGFNVFFLILVALCIRARCNGSNTSRKQEIEAAEVTRFEIQTKTQQKDDESPSGGPPRKPLPPSPSPAPESSSSYTKHPSYLETISTYSSFRSQKQSLGNDRHHIERTPTSRRAMLPPPRHREPNPPRQSSSRTDTADNYETAFYLEPREVTKRPRIQGTGPYAELSYEKRESRAGSMAKSKGYLGLNSLTRIRAKMKRNRASTEKGEGLAQ